MSSDSWRPSPGRRAFVSWWTSVQWYVLGAAALGTAGLGYYGISRFCAAAATPCGAGLTPWDRLYLTIQLFFWESGNQFQGPQVPSTLQIARFAAPLVLGVAAIRGLMALFADQYAALRARWAREHVVVCGLGRQGLALATALRAAGWRVVILERTADAAAVTAGRRVGPVVAGDATDQHALRRAGVLRARHLFAVCGSDAVNAAVVASAAALKPGTRRLTCHAQIDDPALWDRLRTRELTFVGDHARVQFFSALDLVARTVATRLYPASLETPGHVLIAGLTPVSEAALGHLARAWVHTRHNTEPLHVTIVQADAEAAAAALTARHHRLAQACRIIAITAPVPSRAIIEQLKTTALPVTAACVSHGSDAHVLSTSLGLLHDSRGCSFPIVAVTSSEQGIDTLLGTGGDTGRIAVCGLLEHGGSPELLLHSTNELLARLIHDEYVRSRTAEGDSVESNPSMRHWDALPDGLRDSNRWQADHISRKLDAIECDVAPMLTWDAPAITFTDREIERMARMEHARWVKERAGEGWTYHPGAKDAASLQSPYLVEWDLLPESVRNIDRNTVVAIPTLLARVGLGIHRRTAEASSRVTT